MRKYLTAVVLLSALLSAQSALAQNFTIRQWTADSQEFVDSVIHVLSNKYAQQGCSDETGFYLEDLFSELRQLKGTIHAKSYLLLRETLLIIAQDSAPFEDEIRCEVIDKWRFIHSHIVSKIELVGNVLLITDRGDR